MSRKLWGNSFGKVCGALICKGLGRCDTSGTPETVTKGRFRLFLALGGTVAHMADDRPAVPCGRREWCDALRIG